MTRTRPTARRHGPARIESLEGRTLMAASPFDPSFGVGGKSKLDVAGLADGFSVVHALPDGKLLVGGTSTFALTDDPFAAPPGPGQLPVSRKEHGTLMRLNADGTPDPTFDGDGIAEFPTDPHAYVPWQEVPLHPDILYIEALAVQADGKILAGGTYYEYHAPPPTAPQTTEDGTPLYVWNSAFAVARYNPDGSVDRAFGANGVSIVNMLDDVENTGERVLALAIQPDGRIIAAGALDKFAGPDGRGDGGDMAVVRLNTDGSVDATFGKQLIDFPGGPHGESASSVVLQADGKLLIGGGRGGWNGQRHVSGFALTRRNADGTPDTTFGSQGYVTTYFPSMPDPISWFGESDGVAMQNVVVQADGRIVAVGSLANSHLAAARYNADGSPDATFGDGGRVVTRGVVYGHYVAAAAADGTLAVSGIGNGVYYERTPTSAVGRDTGIEVYVAHLDASGRVVSAGRAERIPMAGEESLGALAVQADGKIVAVGSANATRWDPLDNSDESRPAREVHSQMRDGLVVRIDPALLTPDPSTGRDTGGSGGADPGGASMPRALAVRKGRVVKIRLIFASPEAARAASVSVAGPNGFTGTATLQKAKARRRGATVATFVMEAPGGAVDAADNGTYSVSLGGVAAEPRPLGVFTVMAAAKKARGRG